MGSRFTTIDGLPVVNAKKSATIEISNEDVKRGISRKPDKCAAALACRRLTKAVEARVHIGRTYVRFGKKWVRYMTPAPLAREITAIDRGGKFEAGEYTLGRIPPRRSTGKHQGGRADKPGSGSGKPRRKYHITGDIRRMEQLV